MVLLSFLALGFRLLYLFQERLRLIVEYCYGIEGNTMCTAKLKAIVTVTSLFIVHGLLLNVEVENTHFASQIPK